MAKLAIPQGAAMTVGKSAFGAGSEKPLEIGHLGGRAIYLHYHVYNLATSADRFFRSACDTRPTIRFAFMLR